VTLPRSAPAPAPAPAPASGPATVPIGSASVGTPKASGNAAKVVARCVGAAGASCKLTFVMTTRSGKKTAILGTTSVTVAAGKSVTTTIRLNAAGKRLLAKARKVKAQLKTSQAVAGGKSVTVSTKTVTLR
jgi:hypothetical protein